MHYIKCPRCELNYIDADAQDYCDVCQKEMKGLPTGTEDIEEAEEDLPTELCPICGENMIRPGEKMCEECRKKADYEETDPDPDDEDDDEWREYLDDDTDELDEDIDIGETYDEPEEEEEEDFSEEAEEEDLEYVTGDDIYRLAGEDEDDDDDDRGDDEDF